MPAWDGSDVANRDSLYCRRLYVDDCFRGFLTHAAQPCSTWRKRYSKHWWSISGPILVGRII